jgi:hypothetical protein
MKAWVFLAVRRKAPDMPFRGLDLEQFLQSRRQGGRSALK